MRGTHWAKFRNLNYLSLDSVIQLCYSVYFISVAAPIAAAAAAAAAVASNPGLNVAALLASGTQVTPQIAMAAQMAALQAKTLAETGIAVPSYYNPSSVNPMKFADQEKKRKMLWQGKKDGVRLDFAVLSKCVFITVDLFIWSRPSKTIIQLYKHTLYICCILVLLWFMFKQEE